MEESGLRGIAVRWSHWGQKHAERKGSYYGNGRGIMQIAEQLRLIAPTPAEMRKEAERYTDETAQRRKTRPIYATISVGVHPDDRTFVFAHCTSVGRKGKAGTYSYLFATFKQRELAWAVRDRLNRPVNAPAPGEEGALKTS
jgi:hypothetical protein